MNDGKEWVVYRNGLNGFVYSCHKNRWTDWEKSGRYNDTKLADNLTREQAQKMVRLTEEN